MAERAKSQSELTMAPNGEKQAGGNGDYGVQGPL